MPLNPMDHPNLVVVHYDPFAGGKFFINCLAHNANILPGLDVAYGHDSWILEDIPAEEKNQRKIQRILGTIPPVAGRINWNRYELGCIQFWGALFYRLVQNKDRPCDQAITLLQDHICFIVNHRDLDLADSYRSWPKARHLILDNSEQFQNLSKKFKTDSDFVAPKNTWPDLPDAFRLDVDASYFDTDRTVNEVRRCLSWLDVHEQLDPALRHYIESYWAVHPVTTS